MNLKYQNRQFCTVKQIYKSFENKVSFFYFSFQLDAYTRLINFIKLKLETIPDLLFFLASQFALNDNNYAQS
jgi:hypothetical protein